MRFQPFWTSRYFPIGGDRSVQFSFTLNVNKGSEPFEWPARILFKKRQNPNAHRDLAIQTPTWGLLAINWVLWMKCVNETARVWPSRRVAESTGSSLTAVDETRLRQLLFYPGSLCPAVRRPTAGFFCSPRLKACLVSAVHVLQNQRVINVTPFRIWCFYSECSWSHASVKQS